MKHDPDPEFLDHLEWQVQRALRRRDRFARPTSTRTLRTARTLALALVCTLSGAGLVVGAERIQESRRAELLLEQNRIELALADRQLDRAVQRLDRLEALFESGHLAEPGVWSARREALDAERRRRRLALEREEIAASGRAPDLALSAPLVGGRDFRSESLLLDLESARDETEEARRRFERAETLFENGLTSPSERDRARVELKREELELARLQGRLELRAAHLRGELDARAVELADRIEAVEARRREARVELEALERLVEIARSRHDQGVIGPRERDELESELEARQADVELADLELELLREQ
jgi:hypothetical protein